MSTRKFEWGYSKIQKKRKKRRIKTLIASQKRATNKFEQFKIYEDIFGFLFSVKKLKSLDYTFFKEKCLNLEKSLKHDNLLDIDGFDLFS